ncbi:MAG: hydrogenase maturation protease [Chitinivibrionales bacterium]|nr:hydrogenase maturation protease [Chitinivibrionales bacterium]
MPGLSILVYGYGNPGRRDDGLGVLFAEHIGKLALGHVKVETNYQLNAEDALEAAEHDVVIFADASYNEGDSFRFSTLLPAHEVAFTTHAMAPGSVLALCQELYDKRPDAYLLELRGYEWEMGEGLSERGAEALKRAVSFMEPLLREGDRDKLAEAAESVGREE